MNGFVTICDENYLPYLEVLIDGLNRFSKYGIEVHWISDQPIPESSDRARFVKLDVPDNATLQGKWFSKIEAINRTEIRSGMFIDSDMIPNRNVDQIIDTAIAEPRPYPLCIAHPFDPQDQHGVMRLLGVDSKSMRYSYGNYLFSEISKPFFSRLSDFRDVALAELGVIPNADECLLNVLLWKEKVAEVVNFCIPNYNDVGIKYQTGEVFGWPYFCGLSFHLFHSCKNKEVASKFLDFLDSDSSFYTTEHKSRELRIIKPTPV